MVSMLSFLIMSLILFCFGITISYDFVVAVFLLLSGMTSSICSQVSFSTFVFKAFSSMFGASLSTTFFAVLISSL